MPGLTPGILVFKLQRAFKLQSALRKRVASLHCALLVAGHEPLLALRRRAVGETVGHHPARRLPLQRIVADRSGRPQRRVDIAGFDEAWTFLLLAVDPDPRKTIRLQLDLDLQRVGFRLAAGLLLQPLHPRQDAEQVLDVMARFMRDDIGRCEFAGIARATLEPCLDLAEETGVEEYLLVRRAVERPHRRLRHAAAAAIGGVAKQHDARPRIILSAGLEDLAPAVVDLAENTRDHAADLVLWRAGLGRPRLAIGLVGRRLVATGQDFGAADQDARVDAESIADQAEHDDGADAEPATAHREAKTAATATHSAAAIAATVIDIVAAAEIIVTHGGVSSSPGLLARIPNAAIT